MAPRRPSKPVSDNEAAAAHFETQQITTSSADEDDPLVDEENSDEAAVAQDSMTGLQSSQEVSMAETTANTHNSQAPNNTEQDLNGESHIPIMSFNHQSELNGEVPSQDALTTPITSENEQTDDATTRTTFINANARTGLGETRTPIAPSDERDGLRNGTKPSIYTALLGNSILQAPKTATVADMLKEQQALASFYKNRLPFPSNQPRGPVRAPVAQVENPFDYEVQFEEATQKHEKRRSDNTATPQEEMAFLALEKAYKEKKQRAQLPAEEDDRPDTEDEDLFIPENPQASRRKKQPGRASRKRKASDDDSHPSPPTKKSRGPGEGQVSDDDSHVDSSTPAKKTRGQGAAKKAPKTKRAAAKGPKRTTSKVKKGKKKAARPGNRPDRLGASNLIDDAEAAELMPDTATFDVAETGEVRERALKALVENAPEDQREAAKKDRVRLRKAIQQFTGQGSVKPADNGKWRVKGMKTALTAHQVLGASFMREREASESEPRGGILADQMGLGKTLTMIANFINGNSPRRADGEPRTTLIIVPRSLLDQWHREMLDHCENRKRNQRKWGIGKILLYRESDYSNMDPEDFADFDVVLTTYPQISASWPVMDMPESVKDDEERLAWFNENIWEKRGILHKFKWLRIVLDEAHEIRNPATRQFSACRNLEAIYRWAITGTPMVNGSWDLFALFEFIRHPDVKFRGIGDFKKRFCNKNDKHDIEGLTEDLVQCMTRFSHGDKLFGARLVNLPKASSKVTQLHFTKLEAAIYDIVKRRFQNRLQRIADDGKLVSETGHILTMILRLRQLTAHPLMIQVAFRNCIEREDYEKLQEIVDSQEWQRNDGNHIIASLRKILAMEKEPQPVSEHDPPPVLPDGMDEETTIEGPTHVVRAEDHKDIGKGEAHGKNMRFAPYLDLIKASGTWTRMNRTMICTVCSQPPNEPQITDCKHIYCKECLEDMMEEAASNSVDKAPCRACGHPMTSKPLENVGESNQNPGNDDAAPVAKKDDMTNWLDVKGQVLPSTKTIAAKTQILNWFDPSYGGDPSNKVIVFTQWVDMVKVLVKMCETEKWGCTILCGNLSPKARSKNIQAFNTDSNIKILISTLKTGGVGLNLTAASRVIMIDPWWNEAVEQQAYGRVYRIGQLKETSMTRLAIKDSIDDRLFDLKHTKREEISKVMNGHKSVNE